MNPSLEYLERCAATTGFQVAALEKVVRLGALAADMTRHPFLGKVLALKGGTALNLCFGAPRRLSVDLDFNYIGHAEREKMLEDRPRVDDAVAGLAQRLGYRVQESADAFAGRKFYLRYQSVLGQDDRIEADLNYLFRVPMVGTEMREMWQPGELDRPRVRVVGMEELLLGKFLAFLDRGAVRDVWDLAHLPEPAVEAARTTRFRALFIAFAAVLNHPLASYSRERMNQLFGKRSIAEQLAPMLIAGEPVELESLIKQAWAVVEPILTVSADERKYLTAVQHGNLRLELLFPNSPEEAARIAAHPAILWKIANVRAHLNRQR